jgi:O-antigen/teichoic acid export membrane protein
MNFRLAMSLLFGRAPVQDQSLRRYAGILRGGATALVAKAVAAVAGFATVPLTLHHLGPERYGLWATLFSILSWLSLADLGLSNGLISALSEAFALERRDLAREYVSASLWGLTGMAAVLTIVLGIVVPLTDWSSLMHIGTPIVAKEFRNAAALAAVIFLMNLPLSIVGRVFVAAQRPATANFWAIVNSVASVTGLLIAIACQGGLFALVMGFSGGQLAANLASALWLFGREYPELRPTTRIARGSLRRVFDVAASFFLTQLATLLLFQSANVLISHRLGPSYVTPYQITWMLFMYVTLPQQLMGANIWAAIGEAYAKADIQWIRRLYRRYALLGAVTGGPVIIVLILGAAPLIRWWAGPQAVPSRDLILWMAAWACVLLVIQPVIAVLAGTARLRAYSILSLVGAAVAVLAAYFALGFLGPSGVLAAYIAGFGLIAVLPAIGQVRELLREDPAPGPVVSATRPLQSPHG